MTSDRFLPLGMKNKSLNIHCNAGEFLFIVGFCLYLAARILFTSTISTTMGFGSMIKLLMVVGLAAILLSIFLSERVTARSLLLLALVTILAYLVYKTGGADFASLLFIAYAARYYKLRNIIEPAYKVIVYTCVLIVLLAVLGIVDSTTSSEEFRYRTSLGFIWVTFLSHYYLEIVVCYVFLHFHELTTGRILILALIDVAIYSATASRNSFFLTLIFLVFVLVMREGKNNTSKPVAYFLSLSFVACTAISFLIFLLPEPFSAAGYQLNKLMSGRILLTQNAIAQYGITPFGTAVQWVTQSMVNSGQYAANQYAYVDCSYINLMIHYGWVVFSIILVALTVVSYRCTRQMGALAGDAFLIFAIHGVVDPQLLDLHYCVLLVLLGSVFDSTDEWGYLLSGLLSSQPLKSTHADELNPQVEDASRMVLTNER